MPRILCALHLLRQGQGDQCQPRMLDPLLRWPQGLQGPGRAWRQQACLLSAWSPALDDHGTTGHWPSRKESSGCWRLAGQGRKKDHCLGVWSRPQSWLPGLVSTDASGTLRAEAGSLGQLSLASGDRIQALVMPCVSLGSPSPPLPLRASSVLPEK